MYDVDDEGYKNECRMYIVHTHYTYMYYYYYYLQIKRNRIASK